MTRAQRQVDNIGDCGDDDRSTFVQEPGGDIGSESDCSSGGAISGESECGEYRKRC